MASICEQSALLAPQRSRIRVLIADSDLARRGKIASAVLGTPGFDVIADSGALGECRQLIADECPELVIGSESFFLQRETLDQAFPLFIQVGNLPLMAGSFVCALDEPVRESDVRDALALATTRVLTVKAGELSSLIRRYLVYSDPVSSPPQDLYVMHEGRTLTINTQDVHWIKAAGNYVELFTDMGAYVMREPIHRVATRLERAGFVRIHRGIVVNASVIRSRELHQDTLLAVLLADGTRLPVGPNFRDQVPQSPGEARTTAIS